jgi:hypothetical protein
VCFFALGGLCVVRERYSTGRGADVDLQWAHHNLDCRLGHIKGGVQECKNRGDARGSHSNRITIWPIRPHVTQNRCWHEFRQGPGRSENKYWRARSSCKTRKNSKGDETPFV